MTTPTDTQQTIPRRRVSSALWGKRYTTWTRYAFQFGFLALIMYVAVMHQIWGGGPTGTPSVEAYCPFGGLESAWKYVTTGSLLNRITSSTLILTLALIAATAVGKSSFCGWICPLGAIQEWMGNLGRRIFGRQLTLPAAIDRPAQYLRYAVLAWAVVASAAYGTLVIRGYDPFIALAHITTLEFDLIGGFIVLGLTVAASLFTDRPWCRYFCPLGAFVGLLGRISFFKIERDAALCRNCGLCNRACNARIDVAHATRISADACIGCLACTEVCPAKGALAIRPPRLTVFGPWRDVAVGARRAGYAAGILLAFSSVIVVGQTFGYWIDKQGVDGASQAISVSAATMRPEEIKGWMKVGETAAVFGVPIEEVYAQFHIPAGSSPELTFKEMGGVTPGFSAEEFRAWLAKRTEAK